MSNLSDPYAAFAKITGHSLYAAASGIRRAYREKHEIGLVAERRWDQNDFTLGFEYGLLALAAILVEARDRAIGLGIDPDTGADPFEGIGRDLTAEEEEIRAELEHQAKLGDETDYDVTEGEEDEK